MSCASIHEHCTRNPRLMEILQPPDSGVPLQDKPIDLSARASATVAPLVPCFLRIEASHSYSRNDAAGRQGRPESPTPAVPSGCRWADPPPSRYIPIPKKRKAVVLPSADRAAKKTRRDEATLIGPAGRARDHAMSRADLDRFQGPHPSVDQESPRLNPSHRQRQIAFDMQILNTNTAYSSPSIKQGRPSRTTSLKSSLNEDTEALLAAVQQSRMIYFSFCSQLFQNIKAKQILQEETLEVRHPTPGQPRDPEPSPLTQAPAVASQMRVESTDGLHSQEDRPTSTRLSPSPSYECSGPKRRPSRALTGKYVRPGTGASPSTLLTLRRKLMERQKLRATPLGTMTSLRGKSRSRRK